MNLSDDLKNQLKENTVKLCEKNGIEINVETRLERAEKLLVKLAVAIRHDAEMKNYFDEINQFLKGE